MPRYIATDMKDTFNKETISFYLVALAAYMAAIAAACGTAFCRNTGGLAVGFALVLPAFLVGCYGFAYPSPLNKLRCRFMLGSVFTLGVLFAALFVAVDLAGVNVALYNAYGAFQPNAMGILLIVYAALGLLVAATTTARVVLHAFGKSLNDAERRLAAQSVDGKSLNDAPADVTPRVVDERQVLAKADQEVRLNRMSVVPAEDAAPVVTPQAAREIAAKNREEKLRAEQNHAAEVRADILAQTTLEPTPQEERPAREAPAAILDPEPHEERPAEAQTARTILAQPEPIEADGDVIYAQTDDVDDEPVVEVEMAKGEVLVNEDLRTETAAHRPRQKDAPSNDDLYTDFAYTDRRDDTH